MFRMAQRMVSQQAAISRPRCLATFPHISCSDREASRRQSIKQNKWQSSLVLGTAVAALTFATLTRVPQAAAFHPIESLEGVVKSAEERAEEAKEEAKEKTKEAADKLKHKAGETTESAEEAAQHAKERLGSAKEWTKQEAKEFAERAAERGEYAKERVKEGASAAAEHTREAERAARERAHELAERWKGKIRSTLETVRRRTAPLDKVPPLPYHYNDLEPYIDTRTMQLHYDGHHQSYVRRLKEALRKAPELLEKDLNQLMQAVGTVSIWHPEADRDIRNHGGGHWNHSFWWRQLAPAGSKETNYEKSASPQLKEAIEDRFGSLNKLKQAFKEQAQDQFGSGWVWLAVDRSDYDVEPKDPEALVIIALPNQDNPLMDAVVDRPGTPILGLDNWEHSYYIKHGPKKADYVDDVFNVINWRQVSENYEHAKAGKAPPTM